MGNTWANSNAIQRLWLQTSDPSTPLCYNWATIINLCDKKAYWGDKPVKTIYCFRLVLTQKCKLISRGPKFYLYTLHPNFLMCSYSNHIWLNIIAHTRSIFKIDWSCLQHYFSSKHCKFKIVRIWEFFINRVQGGIW